MKSFEDRDGHGSVKTYTLIAIFLAVLTAIEIAIPEIPNRDPRWLFIGALFVLAIIKFVAVVGFFMHLKYDAPFFTHAFVMGTVIAVGTFVALLGLSESETPRMREVRAAEAAKQVAAAAPDPSAVPVAEAANAETTEVSGPSAESGKEIFVNAGCTACHKVADIPSAVGTVGPALDGLASIAASRVDGMDAETYIRQSIEEPGAFVVEAYMKLMPPLRGAMSDQDYESLILYLKGL